MDLFTEMADFAMKEFGSMELIYLSICFLYSFFLVGLLWRRREVILRMFFLVRSQNLRTLAEVGSGLMGNPLQNGSAGSPQIEIGYTVGGLETSGC